MNLKITTNIRGFKSSIRQLRKGFITVSSDSLKKSSNTVADNIKNRLRSSVRGNTPNIIADNISSSTPFYNGKDIIIGIGNIDNLDKVTEVFSEAGNKYHLWRLLEEGWGMKGGKRSTTYPIEPVNAKALRFYVNGDLVFASHVEHPGALGHFFFMDTMRNWYAEDRDIVANNLIKDMRNFLTTINFKG